MGGTNERLSYHTGTHGREISERACWCALSSFKLHGCLRGDGAISRFIGARMVQLFGGEALEWTNLRKAAKRSNAAGAPSRYNAERRAKTSSAQGRRRQERQGTLSDRKVTDAVGCPSNSRHLGTVWPKAMTKRTLPHREVVRTLLRRRAYAGRVPPPEFKAKCHCRIQCKVKTSAILFTAQCHLTV